MDVALGPEHMKTEDASAKLEQVFLITSRSECEKVELLLLKTFLDRLELLGHIDPSTLMAERRLRSFYDALKAPEKMDKHWELAYDSRAERLGANHPDTIQIGLILETAYRERGDWDKLLEFYERRLDFAMKSLRDNPQVVAELERKLKITYFKLGKQTGLLGLLKMLVQTKIKQLGPMHADTVRTLHDIQTLESLSDKKEKIRRAKEDHGYRNSLVMNLLEELAEMYESIEYYQEMEAILQEIISGRCDVLGPRHPHTIAVMKKLAAVYGEQGKYELQEAMEKKIATKRKVSSGKSKSSFLVEYSLNSY
jgi:tetratricopeptide (TPR) repeat protein